MTVFLVDWWSPGKKHPDGDMVIQEVKISIPAGEIESWSEVPKNWNRGDHYRDWFMSAEVAYRYAENIKAELGIKALIGTYESYKKHKEEDLLYRLEVEEVEKRRWNSLHGRLPKY
jgi:hypothetical protein